MASRNERSAGFRNRRESDGHELDAAPRRAPARLHGPLEGLGWASLLLALLLASPGIEVAAADPGSSALAGESLMSHDRPAPEPLLPIVANAPACGAQPTVSIDAQVAAVRAQLIADAMGADGEGFEVLNARGYNYGPAPRPNLRMLEYEARRQRP